MARPKKLGLDYFPHDTDASNDEKIEALRMLYGNDGYAFFFMLCERIYRTPKGELDVSDPEMMLVLSHKMGVTKEKFNKMLNTSLKKNCFDKKKFEKKKILTSNGIKKRMKPVLSKRLLMKRKYADISVDVSESETKNKPDKVKESKVKESKVKKSKEKKYYKTTMSNSVEFRLAELLWDLILKRKPDYKKPDLDAWTKTIRDMIRFDGPARRPDRIEALIIACHENSFEKDRVLDPTRLRRRFDELELKLIISPMETKSKKLKSGSALSEAKKEYEEMSRA